MSVAYIGPKSRTESPRKTKIDTEVAHVTRDLETTFKVERSKVKVTGGGGILWRPPAQIVMPPPHRAEALSDDAHLTSDVCLSDVCLTSVCRVHRA